MVIKNRKCELYKVSVPMFWKTSIDIYVTPKQLAKLNSIPVGKELFLRGHDYLYCIAEK